jgi:hypothetical protein
MSFLIPELKVRCDTCQAEAGTLCTTSRSYRNLNHADRVVRYQGYLDGLDEATKALRALQPVGSRS